MSESKPENGGKPEGFSGAVEGFIRSHVPSPLLRFLAFSGFLVFATLGARSALAERIDSSADRAAKKAAESLRVELREELRKHEANENAAISDMRNDFLRELAGVKGDVHEVRSDASALYRAIMTGQRQARLEVKPDGGTP